MHEEVQRGTLSQLRALLETGDTRGEFTFVVAGAEERPPEPWPRERVVQALRERLEEAIPAKEASREVAREAAWKAREVYDLYTELKRQAGRQS